jgi:hypothetical protein
MFNREEMSADIVPDPGVVARADIDRATPDPEDCLPPGEQPEVTVELSPGWVAITDREFLLFHPDRDPAFTRTPLANVTGLLVRRTGGQPLIGYVPGAILYALFGTVPGSLLLSVSPGGLIAIPEAPGSGQIETIVQTLGWAMGLLGTVLVFSGILAALLAVAVVGYWLLSREVALVIERGEADPIEYPTTRSTGTRAIRELETELVE